MCNLAIFASGNGSNALKIIQHFANNAQVNVRLIISNNKNAGVLQHAKMHNIPTLVLSKSEINHGNNLISILHKTQIDFVVLAGFLLLIPKNVIELYGGKIINIHPSLLPKYGGKGMYGNHVHKAVLNANEKESGITIHIVNQEYDKGKILFQAYCKIQESDNENTLAEKIQKLEHKYYPLVIRAVLKNVLN